MRVGQGFNTYTQEIRLENAVIMGSPRPRKKASSELVPLPSTGTVPLSPPVTPDASVIVPPHSEVPAVAINGIQQPGSHEISRAATPSPPPRWSLGSALDVVTASVGELPFEIPAGPIPTTSQSVTYSTRAIENVSDIMDALNISTSMSIKYGTIHGNGNASFVNENKVLDSELNYVVSVMVNNDALSPRDEMEFQDIPGLPLDRFTEVYGDTFVSGFTEGGEFNAVISIKLNDKSKYRSVKQAVDVQLAVGPPTLEIGASEAIAKEHSEALKNTEISISVNWVGGGEIKKPTVPWTIQSVVAVANAFPSMVARSSARTQAILTRYTSLRSFQAWKWTRLLEERRIWDSDPRNQKGGENNISGKEKYEEPIIILNYVPCAIYTSELFDALMNYKKLWKRIGEMLQNPSQYKMKKVPKTLRRVRPRADLRTPPKNLSPLLTRDASKQSLLVSPIGGDDSPCQNTSQDALGMERAFTFAVDEGHIGWNLLENNARQDPIPPEPLALNEARLLCREAMTLITEEASRLVDHPHLAYAQYDPKTNSTRMKRPNYAYPEVLKERLPIPIHNSIVSDLSNDGAYLKTAAYVREDNMWFEPDMVGDPKVSPDDFRQKYGMGGKYEDFSSLELTEPHGSRGANPLRRIALHRYSLSSLKSWMSTAALRQADNAIGAIGLARIHDNPNEAEHDGCNHHLGHLHSSDDASDFKALDIGGVDITKIEVAYVPGSGYIAGMTFLDELNGQQTERLRWKQWQGKEPQGLVHVINEPPNRGDGTVWEFVGLAGSWIDTLGKGHVLARVSGIWKKAGEE
ncbi:uncharacterized protein N0V89_000125 [Didymosphaeria variabile]|uniref:Uncharacterized protein n=1 Tax=Didymosphaeria variabile TaxID=1932322 RepID=A0A9W9CFK9_9PLEO|nr:uncharacterized protein N0V89_000125 [Didymosphaeria variabile]KAJ4359570.1 hypothetical protein N0V89_000125 [Didymosphaeria variabile]